MIRTKGELPVLAGAVASGVQEAGVVVDADRSTEDFPAGGNAAAISDGVTESPCPLCLPQDDISSAPIEPPDDAVPLTEDNKWDYIIKEVPVGVQRAATFPRFTSLLRQQNRLGVPSPCVALQRRQPGSRSFLL